MSFYCILINLICWNDENLKIQKSFNGELSDALSVFPRRAQLFHHSHAFVLLVEYIEVLIFLVQFLIILLIALAGEGNFRI
jgi:hypothetical protein